MGLRFGAGQNCFKIVELVKNVWETHKICDLHWMGINVFFHIFSNCPRKALEKNQFQETSAKTTFPIHIYNYYEAAKERNNF